MNQSKQRKRRRQLATGMLLTLMLCVSGVLSASPLQVQRMSVKLENGTLRELFHLIEEKFDYSFLVRNNDIDLSERLTLDVTDQPVENILTDALKKQDATFTVNNQRIMVYKAHTTRVLPVVQAAQQAGKVTGTVVDAMTGEPVIGANVTVKGTTVGTITDINGHFSLEAPEGSVLVISYIGYLSIQQVVTKAPMQISLREDTQALEEIVVVGYGVQKKESLTGALQTLNNEKLTNITTPSVQNMLNGKIPGVFVAPGDGRPGSAGRVIIRGKASINGETQPLWVIDGVIVGTEPGTTLNPNDIETMTVLKDAASTALFGSQGANGVIVVTTKKGSADKLTVDVSAKFGLNNLDNGKLEMMNGAELYDYYKSFSNQEMISFPRWNENLRKSDYNWWDIATQTGMVQEYNASVSGGTEKLRSYCSFGYYDEKGAVIGYDYKKYSFRLRTELKPIKWLTIKPLISGTKRDIDNRERSVSAMYSYLPWDSPYLEDGKPTPPQSKTWVNSTATNYLYDLQWNKGASVTYTFMGNLDFDIRITDWLTFASVNNYSYTQYEDTYLTDPRSYAGSGVKGRLTEETQKTERRYTNQILRFNRNLDKHAFNGLVAYEYNDYRFKTIEADGTGFVPGFEVLNVTAKPEKAAGYILEKVKQSFLFNMHYAYDNKYLAQVSFRRDGASNFGDSQKYGSFFSISGGWNIEREAFMDYSWLNQLKLRASYGTTGNDPTSLYPQYDLYAANSTYNETPGALIYQIGNKNLTWEKTYTLDIGLDLAVFDRLRMSLDFYHKYTDNVLFSRPVSGLTGVTSVWQNIGEMRNRGVDISMGADIVKTKDWQWSADFNMGINRNKIEKLYGASNPTTGEPPVLINSSLGGIAGSINGILKPGYDADTYYGREWAGVNPENGKPQWYMTDKKTNERILTESYAEADEVILGRFSPDFFGGFSTQMSWKNLDFDAVFGYSVGGKIYHYSRSEYDSDGAYTDRNQMRLYKGWNRWQKTGDVATHPLPAYNNPSNSNKVSSRFIEKGDYLKLRSLTLGYTLNLPQWQISALRLFISAENVFTLTGYSGVDPETPVNKDGIKNITINPYPNIRKFIFGVNFTL